MPTISPPPRGWSEQPQTEGTPASVLHAPAADDERLQLVERIVAGEAFQKSSRLPSLLRYLASCTLANNRAALTEQAIGRAVFDKPADFRPTEDSSVRVYVRQLRLRLHEFYQSTGQNEPIVIEIPKGGYALAFHSRHQVFSLPETQAVYLGAPSPAQENPPRRSGVLVWLPWALAGLCLLLAAVGWYLWSIAVTASAPPWPLDQVIQPSHQTTVVLADGTYMLRLLGDQEVKLDEYADHRYTDHLIPQNASEGELRLFHYLQASQLTSMADAHAVSAITELAGSSRKSLVLRSAKELNGAMLASGNFIFVGAKTSNPWSELYEDRLNFRLVETGLRGTRYIENRSPLPGEQMSYSINGSTGLSGDDYATISVLPSTSGQGTVLLLQGLRLEGTEAAIRFLNNSEDRAAMARKLKEANAGSLPHYFEVLLHAHSVAGSAASIECVAARSWPTSRR